MKIIEKEYINTCSCGTTLVYKKSDLYYSRDYYRYYLTCPTCGETKDSVCYSLFSKEYKNDDKDKEIERLNNKLELISTIVEREFPPNEFITYRMKKILRGVDKE